jgi:hypothetical protein
MHQIKVSQIADCVTQLLEIEVRACLDTIRKAKKDKEDESILMGQAYLLGLQRAKDIINIVLKDVKD